MRRVLRPAADRGFRLLGFDLTDRGETVLERALRLGIRPGTVIDVGAAWGQWASECHTLFPHAQYLLVEPLEEAAGALDAVAERLGGTTRITAAAAAEDGERTINVHADFVGTSLFTEAEGESVDGTPRLVPTVTLDTLVARHEAAGPYVVKLDVQGAELEVLAGAARVLQAAELVIAEVTFFEVFRDGPLAHEVVAWMLERDFVIYDIFELMYRPLDGALVQANVAFAPRDGSLRQDHRYATPEQRSARNAASARAARRRFAGS